MKTKKWQHDHHVEKWAADSPSMVQPLIFMLTCSTRSSFFTSSPSLSSVLISKRTSYVFPNLGGGPECCLARQTYWPKMHISLACINANKMSHSRSDPRWPCPSFDSRWEWPWGDNPTNKMHARKYYISYINRKVPIPQKTASCSCHFRLLLQGRKTHTLNMFQCGKCCGMAETNLNIHQRDFPTIQQCENTSAIARPV